MAFGLSVSLALALTWLQLYSDIMDRILSISYAFSAASKHEVDYTRLSLVKFEAKEGILAPKGSLGIRLLLYDNFILPTRRACSHWMHD